MWELTIDEDVWDKLEKIPNPHKQRIQKSILALESGPDFLDIKTRTKTGKSSCKYTNH